MRTKEEIPRKLVVWIMTIMIVGGMCNAITLTPNEYLLFEETDHRVDLGTAMGDIDFSLISPCKLHKVKTEHWNEAYHLRGASFSKLNERCEQEVRPACLECS